MERTIEGNTIPRLLTVADIERRTGLKKMTVYNAVRAGLLPCVRIGRKLFFLEAAIADHLQRGGAALPGGWRRDARSESSLRADQLDLPVRGAR